jgi:hypothetical protein
MTFVSLWDMLYISWQQEGRTGKYLCGIYIKLNLLKDCFKEDSFMADFVIVRNTSELNKIPLHYILILPAFMSNSVTVLLVMVFRRCTLHHQVIIMMYDL